MAPAELNKLNKLLDKDSVRIVLTTHKNPDGDAIGSVLALYGYLRSRGFNNVECIVPDAYPSFLAWLPNNDVIYVFENDSDYCNELIKQADIIFSLDYNAFHRTGIMEESLTKASGKKVLIDHHLEPDSCFDISYSKIDTSSTAELIYNFIESNQNTHLITKAIAEALYVGIMTDTGSFSYSCNYEKTYHIVAHLIKLGIDSEKIHQLIYNTFTENRLRLLGYCLSERLTVLKEKRTAYIYLTKEDLNRFNYQTGDTEGVVNYALSIEDIEIAALFTERDDLIRISLRSKGDFSVNDFARKYFDGGGHKRAAGGNSYESMQNTLKRFEEKIRTSL